MEQEPFYREITELLGLDDPTYHALRHVGIDDLDKLFLIPEPQLRALLGSSNEEIVDGLLVALKARAGRLRRPRTRTTA